MQVRLERTPFEQLDADAAIVLAFEETKADRLPDSLKYLADTGEVSGKMLEFTLLHGPENLKAKRLLLAGAGKREKFNPAELRKLAGAAVRFLKPRSIRRIALVLEGDFASPEYAEAAVQGGILGAFEPDEHKSDKSEQKPVDEFAIASANGSEAIGQAVDRARIIAEAQNLARNLVNQPANLLPPLALVERAREAAAGVGLEFEVLDQDRMRQLGMGALLGVAQGSAEPPALMVIRYRPEGVSEGGPHLGLVGKAVTFDTGGISIKPADGMEKMKYDMAGGAATIAAMSAIAQLRPPLPVTGFIPAVENMPGSRAQRPGDIVKTLSGKTVEVINTDAEGRLILADAITYAKQLGCTHLVNAATLTGAIVIALGHVHVGAFGNDDAFLRKVLNAGKATGERLWHMPLDDDYKEYLKTPFADLPNVGGRWGGAITAAYFLKEFADETPWVHLDIAGTAWLDDAKPFMSKGPTGVAVRTFVQLAANW